MFIRMIDFPEGTEEEKVIDFCFILFSHKLC